MIPQETIDLIMDTVRIDDVVGDFVSLKRRGASFVACCPFHNEKTPSFYVTPSKGIYKCFGCGKAGNAVSFVMEHEHCSYVEAIRYLADKYHIEIVEEQESAEQIVQRQRHESLMLVMDFAQKFYSGNLSSGEGRSVGHAYYRSRGLEDATIAEYGLGWAPSSRTALHDAAIAAGFKEEYLLEAGLCLQYDDGTVVDRFRERVTFPIHSVNGKTIAFSCRTLKTGDIAKYVNSPDTPLYDKSRCLYGIALAKSEIARQERCYLAEGNVDVVTLHQTGVRNVVASCGTALTVQQVRLIKKFTENVTVMYDGDAAGIHAAQKAINLILGEGMNVSLLLFPDGDDPDSYCRKHTLEELQAFISGHEMDFVSYLYEVGKDRLHDPVKRSGLINEVADAIACIPDAVRRSVFVDTAAAKLGISSEALFERIIRTRARAAEEQRKAEIREQRYRDNIPDYIPQQQDSADFYPAPEQQLQAPAIENKTLQQAEKDLLYFLVTHGRDTLDFESDSEYYSGSEEDKTDVAQFIRDALESDGSVMANSLYRNAYDEYFRHYDALCSQDEIVRKMMSCPDRAVADLTAELSIEKYRLTVRNFASSMTATSSWLVAFVPKSIIYYNERRIQYAIDTLRSKLGDASDQTAVMQKIVKLQAAHRRIKEKLGRDKTI